MIEKKIFLVNYSWDPLDNKRGWWTAQATGHKLSIGDRNGGVKNDGYGTFLTNSHKFQGTRVICCRDEDPRSEREVSKGPPARLWCILPKVHPAIPSSPSLRVVLVAQSCLALCDPMDCGSPGSSVHGILQDTGVGCHFLLRASLSEVPSQ